MIDDTLELLRDDATLAKGISQAKHSSALMDALLQRADVRSGRLVGKLPRIRFARAREVFLRLLLADRGSELGDRLRLAMTTLEDGGNTRVGLNLQSVERFENVTYCRLSGRVRQVGAVAGLRRLQAVRLDGPALHTLDSFAGSSVRMLLLVRLRDDLLTLPLLPRLQVLRLRSCELNELRGLPAELRALDLRTSDVGLVPELSRASALVSLHVGKRPVVTQLSSGLQRLGLRQPMAPTLERLAPTLRRLRVEGVPELTAFDRLEALEIDGADSLESLGTLPRLEHLVARRVGDLRIRAPRLRTLTLVRSDIQSFDGFDAPALERVTLEHCPRLHDVSALADRPLRYASFRDCPALESIDALPETLRILRLMQTGVPARGTAEHLAPLLGQLPPEIAVPEAGQTDTVRKLVQLLKTEDSDTIREAVELTVALGDADVCGGLLGGTCVRPEAVVIGGRSYARLDPGPLLRGSSPTRDLALRELVARAHGPVAETLRNALDELAISGRNQPVEIGDIEGLALRALAIRGAPRVEGRVPTSVRSLTLEGVDAHPYDVGDIAELRLLSCSGQAPDARRLRQLVIKACDDLTDVAPLLASGRLATLDVDIEVELGALPRTLRELRYRPRAPTRVSIRELHHLPRLRALTLARGVQLSDVDGLERFGELSRLELPAPPTTGARAAIESMMSLPLKHLALDAWTALTVDELAVLAEHPTLESFSLTRCWEHWTLPDALLAKTTLYDPVLL